ncbi:hypothetical protein CMI45_00810 [Candidatus Pacearchaeota archaeon]|jgi:amino acid permease|nr:hypothetical protein [Candidatus Pacearchaeota archaeon]|tara:strand:- start:90 stop:1211 length:1122 start_codon:yes stop_codon:yes gene_type:complete
MSKVKTFTAIATLMGTAIGAGILGIPYVASLSGFPIALVHLIVIGALVLLTVLYLGEIGLRTKKNHQLPGYAELYLGKKGKNLMILAFAFGIYAALIAYLIGESQSLSFIFFDSAKYSLSLGFAFWLILSLVTYRGLKSLEQGEKLGVSAIIILIVAIAVLTWKNISPQNISYINPQNFFVPFGVILFAYLGFAATPEVERILKNNKKSVFKSLITAYILIFLIYTVFTFVVLGSQGLGTTEIATLSLGKIFILLGMFTMLTSYLGLSIAMIDTLKFDYNFSKNKAWLLTSLPPLAFFVFLELFSLSSFSKALGIGGALSGGLTAILILLMIKSAKQKGKRVPEYSMPYSKLLTWILIAIFTIGAIFEIANVI